MKTDGSVSGEARSLPGNAARQRNGTGSAAPLGRDRAGMGHGAAGALKTEVQVRLVGVEAFVLPADIDVGAGTVWVRRRRSILWTLQKGCG